MCVCDDDDCTQLSCPLEGGGSGKGGRRSERSEKDIKKGTHVRRGRYHKSIMVTNVGCKGRINIDGGVAFPLTRRAEGTRGLILSSHDKN